MPKGRHGWDFEKALKHARARIEKASGQRAVQDTDASLEPVRSAMARAERAAPALVDFCHAVTLGTDPQDLDKVRGGVRIQADLAVRQLNAIGIGRSELVEPDASERFRAFLTAFFSSSDRPLPPRALPLPSAPAPQTPGTETGPNVATRVGA